MPKSKKVVNQRHKSHSSGDAAKKTNGAAKKRPKATLSPFLGKANFKSEKVIELPNGDKVRIDGVRAEGKRYVLLRIGGQQSLTPYAAWHGNGTDASSALRAQGITIVGSMQDIRTAVAELKRWRKARVSDESGWVERGFALPSGEILIGPGEHQHFRAFAPVTEIMDRRGSFDEWRAQVAKPLGEHGLASFCMMACFAPALLRLTNRADNFGFELAGPAGRGKSTLQLLMASSAGPAIGSDGATYWRTCNATMNALEATMSQFNDMPLILDEAGLVQGSGRVDDRGREMRSMAFRLSQGRVKHRLGEPPSTIARMIFILSTNRSVGSLLGSSHALEADAIADRLMTIPLTADRKYGVFDRLPKDWSSTSAFADNLKSAAAAHFGHALPRFLEYLIQWRIDDEGQLRRWIAKCVANFVKACGSDPNDGSQRRVAEAFGLVYAAGRLAKRAGVLPDTYRCRTAALACYGLHRNHGRVARAFDDRLAVLICGPDTIDLGKVDISKVSAKVLARCPAFLYTGRSGERELLLRRTQRHRAFPDWNRVRHGSEVERRLKPSKDRNVVPRPIVPGQKPEDVYCFDITDLEI